MLNRVDRVQLTARDAGAVAGRWVELLDARILDTDDVAPLNARRVTIQVGDCLVEVLEPSGDGYVADHLNSGRGGPLSIGVTTDDPDALRKRLIDLGIEAVDCAEQLFLHESQLRIPGLNMVVSAESARAPVGLMRNLYEATHLTSEVEDAAADLARIFDLNAGSFVPIRSEQYGYDGVLTLFDSGSLDRVEMIHPYDQSKTMGRFFDRFGPCLYMCYGETDQLGEIRDRLTELAPDSWTGSDENDDGLFLHPKALGGVMLGVSRTSHAWTWSGYPERRIPLPNERSNEPSEEQTGEQSDE